MENNKDEKIEKNDILEKNDSVENSKENSKLNINNTLLIVVGLLVVMSAVQVYQFQNITEAISNGAVNVNTQTSGSKTALPSQVGGCG